MTNQSLRRRPRLSTILAVAAAAAAGACSSSRLGLALMAAAALLVAAALGARKRPRTVVIASVVLLAFLGLLRRVLHGGASSGVDPVLLTGPAAALLLLLFKRRDRPPSLSVLATGVLGLTGVLALSSLNPEQGGFGVGAAGFFLVGAPTLWFWAGRRVYASSLVRQVEVAIAGAGVIAAAYGIYQVLVGFPPIDQAFIQAKQESYVSLSVDGVIRPFGPFTAASDYGVFLAISCVLLVHLMLTSRKFWRLVTLPALIVIAVALVLASQRGPLVLVVIDLTVLLAIRVHAPLPLVLAAGAAAVIGFSTLAASLTQTVAGSAGVGTLINHVVGGLAHPFNSDNSTLSVHAELVRGGFTGLAKAPLGHGVASIAAATTQSTGSTLNSEFDASNAAIAAGVPGLAFFIIAFGRAGYLAARSARAQGAGVLACLLVLIASIGQWMSAGNYASVTVVWLFIGFLDASTSEPAKNLEGSLGEPFQHSPTLRVDPGRTIPDRDDQ